MSHRLLNIALSEWMLKMCKSLNLLISLLLISTCQFVFAGSICLKNKEGVDESWQTSDKDVAMFNTNDSCAQTPGTQVISTPVQASTQGNSAITRPIAYQQDQQIAAVPVATTYQQPSSKKIQRWDTSPSDQNMRLLIQKWADSVGWLSKWDVERDIPLAANDNTTGDFKFAVRHLLSTTTLTDFSVKPCFYTNNLVRVVRETTKCDPNQ